MLKKIKKIWTNKWEILEGFFNYHFRKRTYKKVAKRRYDVCKQCPLIDLKGDKCEVAGTQPCCGSCGCSLNYKVYSLSSACPEGYWHAIMTEEEEDAFNADIDIDSIIPKTNILKNDTPKVGFNVPNEEVVLEPVLTDEIKMNMELSEIKNICQDSCFLKNENLDKLYEKRNGSGDPSLREI